MKPPTTHQRLIQLIDVLDLWIEHPTDEPRHFDTDDLRLLRRAVAALLERSDDLLR